MRHDTVTKPPRELLYLEDLHVGRRFTSATHSLDERQILAFANEFDPQPFHTDREAAKGSLFRGLAASGWHTAAITMRLQVDGGLPIAGGIIGLGGEVTWPTATRPGDVLHVESEVVDVVPSRSRPDRGTVTVRSETRNQRGEIVQRATVKLLVPRQSNEDRIALRDGYGTPEESPNRSNIPQSASTPPPVGSNVRTARSTDTGSRGRPVRTPTDSYGSVASYVIALSQTDTSEQAAWMHALETRVEGADRRVRSAVQVVVPVHDTVSIDEGAAPQRRQREGA